MNDATKHWQYSRALNGGSEGGREGGREGRGRGSFFLPWRVGGWWVVGSQRALTSRLGGKVPSESPGMQAEGRERGARVKSGGCLLEFSKTDFSALALPLHSHR